MKGSKDSGDLNLSKDKSKYDLNSLDETGELQKLIEDHADDEEMMAMIIERFKQAKLAAEHDFEDDDDLDDDEDFEDEDSQGDDDDQDDGGFDEHEMLMMHNQIMRE